MGVKLNWQDLGGRVGKCLQMKAPTVAGIREFGPFRVQYLFTQPN